MKKDVKIVAAKVKGGSGNVGKLKKDIKRELLLWIISISISLVSGIVIGLLKLFGNVLLAVEGDFGGIILYNEAINSSDILSTELNILYVDAIAK